LKSAKPEQGTDSNFLTMNPARHIARPALFVCDIQEKFRSAIYNFPAVIATTQKLLKAASILNIPVFTTTQNAKALGPPCSELDLENAVVNADKSLFSMYIPELKSKLAAESSVAIVGIESHICVMQTTLDLLRNGHRVYVISDGISSCNVQEVPIALSRMQQAGAIITSSESWLFECMGDAAIPEFKSISSLVKASKSSTRQSLEDLCGPRPDVATSKI